MLTLDLRFSASGGQGSSQVFSGSGPLVQRLKIQAPTDLQTWRHDFTQGKSRVQIRKGYTDKMDLGSDEWEYSKTSYCVGLPFMGFKRKKKFGNLGAHRKQISVMVNRLGHVIVFLLCMSFPIIHPN